MGIDSPLLALRLALRRSLPQLPSAPPSTANPGLFALSRGPYYSSLSPLLLPRPPYPPCPRTTNPLPRAGARRFSSLSTSSMTLPAFSDFPVSFLLTHSSPHLAIPPDSRDGFGSPLMCTSALPSKATAAPFFFELVADGGRAAEGLLDTDAGFRRGPGNSLPGLPGCSARGVWPERRPLFPPQHRGRLP